MRRARSHRVLPSCLAVLALVLTGQVVEAATEAKVPVEELELASGMKFLLVRQPERNTVSAGWVAHVGSANERPGVTGLSHLFEHMLSKGSHIIGTTDIERDLELIAEQERIQERLRQIYREQRQRWRRGEIDDPFAAEHRTPEQFELEQRFQELVEEQRKVMVKDEFDKIFVEAGASRLNAGTTVDFTLYFVTVPANKLELWFWMESDRLMNPVFREFYAERDVVHEERRMRVESSPTGEFDEQFEAMFWQSHPYSWPIVGWPSDLKVISKEQADEYYDTYYSPNNLTAVLVGNFDTDEVKGLIQRYFSRLERGRRDPPDVVTLEVEQQAEKRMVAECDCQPQIEVRYHTVPFMHADSYALDVLEGLMSGRTGRLYKSMVLGPEIASSASAGQLSQKWGGYFSFTAETKGDATPADLEAAWYEQLRKIQEEPIPDEELQKVKNQIAADAFRRLDSPFFLMLQLLFYDGLGDWRYINQWADKTIAVTAEDVKRVAGTYFAKNNRAVAHYFRKEGAAEEAWPAELSELPRQQQQMVKQQIRQLRQIEDPAQLSGILSQIRQQKPAAPAEFRPAIDVVERWLQRRIEEVGQAAEPAAPAGGGE